MLAELQVPLRTASEQNHRGFRFLSRGEYASEVGIRRNVNPFVGKSPIKYLLVVRMLYGVIANVDGIIARIAQARGKLRGQ